MKDSRLGSYGAIALWFGLSAKFLLLQSLVSRGLIHAMFATVIAHMLGRAAAVGVLHLQPHVGLDAGRAQPFCRRLPTTQLIATLAPPAVATIVFFDVAGVPILAGCALVVFLGSIFFKKRLGGITGDCLGATVQVTEISVLAIALSKS
jgi:adenosylcobinamide-GDP ribazoletransferase